MRGTLSWILLCAMLVALFGVPVGAQAASVQAAPLYTQSGSADGTMRVWLSSIKYNNAYNLTVSGSYSIGGVAVSGSALKVEFSGGSIYLTQNGVTTNVGTNLTLTRHSGGIKIAESLSPANTYPGDLRFVSTGGTNYVICHIYIEDYLYGVLPYEMDNTFPLEALKAQAVAARTYSAAAKKGNSLYDVTDTIDNQVFRGVNYTKTQCIQAVDATRGVVMKYNGQYIAANYTASNGGQTELNSNAWGSSRAGYFQVKDDPFDLANTSSVSKSYLIYSSPDKGSSVSANAMIREAIAKKRGGVANNYVINEITDVTVHTPKFASPSRVYTQLRVSVRYNGNMLDVVDIPLFSTVENALGLSINSASNELFTVTKEANGYRVTSRRYGHGVGMSQRGAEQMARNGYRYADILGFYYAGIQLLQVSFTFNGTSSPVVTPGPTVSAGGSGQTTTDVKARVSLENPNNRLNLREEPNISSPVVARLAHGETVTIVGETGTWYRVSYSAAVGYVAKEYLIVQATATQTPGSSGNTSTDTAYVTLQSGMLNLRREPRATSAIVGNIPNGSSVTVINKDATWSQISYGSLTGYVMTQYLTMANPTAGNSEGTAVVTLTNTNESLNMRMNPSTTSPIVMRLRHGTVLTVHERNATWSKVSSQGVVGYVMNSYVRFQGGTATAQPTYAPTAAPTVVETWKANVTLSYGTLNMRSQPNTSSNIVVNIPNRAEVLVTQLTDTWCAVTYGRYSGYVMRRYLTIGDRYTYTATAAPTAQPTAAAGGGSSGTSAWVTTASGGGVHLRGAPSENGSVLATMQTGAEVKILESDTQWTYAQYGVLTGYVATTYLTKTRPGAVSTPTQPGTSSSSSGYGYIQTRSGGPVNLRQNPSTSAVVLMEVAHGTYVELLSDGPQWAQVRVGNLTGYVASEYVSRTQPQAIATQAPSNNTAVVNRGTVNVGQGRVVLTLLAQPDVGAQHVATVDNQTSVDVLKYAGYNAQWLQVRTGSVTGYAPRSDIALRYSVAAVSLQGSADSSVSLRSSASDSASIVGTATEGTVVSVMSSDGYGWTQVMLPNGVTGYMRTALLRSI